MTDFDGFVAYVGRIVKFILAWTLNIICLVLLVIQVIAPWRWCALVSTAGTRWSQNGFRSYCWNHFVRTLGDLVLLPLVLLTCWWPPRICRFASAWKEHGSRKDEWNYAHRLRGYWAEHCCQVIGDILALPFVAVALIAPWRCCILCSRVVGKYTKHSSSERRLTKMRSVGVREGFNALVDMPFVAFALVAIFTPWRWHTILVHSSPHQRRRHNCDYRRFLFVQPFMSVMDVVLLVLGLLALIALPRTPSYLKSLWIALREHRSREENIWRWPWFGTCVEVRRKVAYYGTLALIDFLTLPALVLIILTVYRIPKLCKREQCEQGFCGRGVAEPFLQETPEPEHSIPTAYQKRLVNQLGMLVLDILVLPFVIVTFISGYRSKRLLHEGCGTSSRLLDWHISSIQEGCLVVHDLVMMIALLLLTLSVYRVPHLRAAVPERGLISTLCGDAFGPFRKGVWYQCGQLLLDLPTLPILFLLTITMWRADYAWTSWRSNRRGVWLQAAFFLRDALCLPLVLVVVASVVRAPGLILDLIVASRGPCTEDAVCQAVRAEMVAQSEGPDGHRPGIDLVLTAPSQPLGRLLKLRLFARGMLFWNAVESAFGSTISMLAKSFLPFRMKDGDHVQYADFVAEPGSEITLSWRMGGRALKRRVREYAGKMVDVHGEVAVMIQIDFEAEGGQRGVLMRVPIRLRTILEALDNDRAEIDLTTEVEADEPLPFREAFWTIAVDHFIRVCLDIIHIALFCITLICPWRWLGAAYFLIRRTAWPLSVLSRAKAMEKADDLAAAHALEWLEDALHDSGKQGQEADFDALSRGYGLVTPWVPQWMRRETDAELSVFAHWITDRLGRHRAIRSGRVQYAASQMLLANWCRHHVQRSVLQERVRVAAQSLSTMLANSAETWIPDELCTNLVQVATSSGDDAYTLVDRRDWVSHFRRVVRWHGFRAIEDLLAFVSMIILIASIYRVPRLLNEIRERGLKTMKVVVWHHIAALGRDVANLILAIVSVLICMLLLIHCFDLLGRLPMCRNLIEVRLLAWRFIRQSCQDLWKVLTLACAWKTYKYLITASLYSLLLPASALPLPGHALCILCWLALLAISLCFPTVLVPVAGSVAVVALAANGRKFSQVEGWESESLCLSWMNIMSFIGIVVDVVVLAEPSVLHLISSKSMTIIATVFASIWIILISLPFSMPSEAQKLAYQTSGPLCAYVHAMLHALFLPVAFGLLYATSLPSRVLLLVFLVSVTGSLGQQVYLPHPEQRADWRHPSLFLAGHRVLQLVALQAPNILSSHAIVAITSVTSASRDAFKCGGAVSLFLWAAAFALQGCLAASPIAVALRLAAPLMLLAYALMPRDRLLVAAVALFLGLSFTVVGVWLQARRSKKELAKALPELSLALSRLRFRLRRVLVCKELPLAVQSPSGSCCNRPVSASTFAQALLTAEASLGAEHLEEEFLSKRRHEWKSAVCSLMSRPEPNLQPYEQLRQLTNELAINVVLAPPTPTALIAMLRKGSARRVPEPVWWKIMHYCFDIDTIASRSFALAHIGSKEAKPKIQMERAWKLVRFAVNTRPICSESYSGFSNSNSVVVVVPSQTGNSNPLWPSTARHMNTLSTANSWDAVRSMVFASDVTPVSFVPDGIEEDYQLGYNTGHPSNGNVDAPAIANV